MGMNGSVIVWDLETVPDIGGFAAGNDLVGKTDNEVRQLIGDKFPKHKQKRSNELSTSRQAASRLGTSVIDEAVVLFVMALLSCADSSLRA
jgi:hypothetical protein